MPNRYGITTNGAAGGRAADSTQANGAMLGLNSPGTARRGSIYDVVWGSDFTAADNQLGFFLSRHSAITGDDVTPQPLDPADGASILTGEENISAVTLTSGADLLATGANQRSMQRWVAAPGGELVIPASANAGITFSGTHASAVPTYHVTMHFFE